LLGSKTKQSKLRQGQHISSKKGLEKHDQTFENVQDVSAEDYLWES
jgi:hypothetical protein